MQPSDDLLAWPRLEAATGRPLRVRPPRPGSFASGLVGGGPPAILTAHGIVLVYNAGNGDRYGAPDLPPRVCAGGQALYDARAAFKLIARADQPFIRPTEAYERTGQYVAGTTFVEGLVPFHGGWYLYYGTADSRVGVAIWDPTRRTREGGRSQ